MSAAKNRRPTPRLSPLLSTICLDWVHYKTAPRIGRIDVCFCRATIASFGRGCIRQFGRSCSALLPSHSLFDGRRRTLVFIAATLTSPEAACSLHGHRVGLMRHAVPLLLPASIAQLLAVRWPPEDTAARAAVCCTSSPPHYCLSHALRHSKLAKMSYTGDKRTESSILQQ